MDDAALLRYSRHILLPQVGIAGQEKLRAARVLMIGAGGLGSPVALYLAASGVGHITLVDPDHVEIANLQRQIAHDTPSLGQRKVESAALRMRALNPECVVETHAVRAEADWLARHVPAAEVIVDGSDNFATRFSVNAACVRNGRPLVSGAAIRMEGQLAVFDPRQPESPCYRCLYPEGGELEESCTQSGILAPVVGVIGAMQAVETLKLLTGCGEAMTGKLLLYDAATGSMRTLRLTRDPHCPVCGARVAGHPIILNPSGRIPS